jgi:hypothetical protein
MFQFLDMHADIILRLTIILLNLLTYPHHAINNTCNH